MIISRQFRTLFSKEVRRFLSVWGQTVTTPVLSAFLYLFIFGVAVSMGSSWNSLSF